MRLENSFTISESVNRNDWLKWISIIWAFVIIAPLIYFPGAAILTGHPWKVELSLSLILSAFFIGLLLKKSNVELPISPNAPILRAVIFPLAAFVLWSAFSALWADSLSSAWHHTLLWAVYLIFFSCALSFAANRRLLRTSLLSFSCVVGMIAVLCVVEFAFSERIGETFGFRYARFAEIFATTLPLFFSFVLRLKGKHLFAAFVLTAGASLAILCSMSRGALLSSAAGMTIFVVLRLCAKTNRREKRRLIAAAAGIIFIILLTQFSPFDLSENKGTAVDRLVSEKTNDENNSFSKNVRFMLWSVALEMFDANKITGIGADNFGLEFNEYRAAYSAREENRQTANQQEELMPERAHNEYLQIAAELGIVGIVIFSAFIFGVVRLGFSEIRTNFNQSSILSHAALAGIVAFLISSSFSSFSFRLMQNGIVFFFLLALLLRNFSAAGNSETAVKTFAPPIKKLFAASAAVVCLSLFIFSAFKASSQYLVYRAVNETDFTPAEAMYKNAARLDRANGSADFYYGMRLLQEGKNRESAGELRRAIDKGLNSSLFYSYLAAAQILSDDYQSAKTTLAEAARIYPSSTFVRVRYSSILKKTGDEAEAAEQFASAERIDSKQAHAWRDLIDGGVRVLNQKHAAGLTLIAVGELYPSQAVYGILIERETLHPEERIRYDLNR